MLRRRKELWDEIEFHRLSAPDATDTFDRTLPAWQEIIEYELTNPEFLEPLDAKIRVRLAFDQCVCVKRFRPEIWYRLDMPN